MKMRIIYWIPRIIGILAILFMMMFSFDCFGGEYNLKEQLICFFMHNIPSFIIVLFLVIAWKWEMIGGVLFIVACIAMSIFFKSFAGNPASLIVIAPFLLAGILFIVYDQLNKTKA
jgi:hypothetical protein